MTLALGTATLVGLVAATCTTAAFVPQVVRVWRMKAAKDISLTTFVVFSIGSFVWLVYGILIASTPVILANALTLMLALAILSLKIKFDRSALRSAAE